MRSLIRMVMRNPALHRRLRAAYTEEAARRGAPPTAVETSIGELLPVAGRPSTIGDRARFNLIVPALSLRHAFGGINTAVKLFEGLIGDAPDARIVLTDEQMFGHADNPAFERWQIASMDDEDRPGRWIVAAGNRYGRSLPVGAGDRFMATAWWTAYLTRRLMRWQEATFGVAPRRFVYLIQDFEPGFYPWSARFALAESTYREPGRFVPVFNTSLLKSFFVSQGHPFADALYFEATLHPQLLAAREAAFAGDPPAREPRVLVYGRPGVARNGFALIVQALSRWIETGADARWRFLSVGEPHPPIDLGGGRQLVSLGKLSIADYAAELLRASLGISLMVSPHPSYPPLEMAAFGLRVITNGFGDKDLSRWNPGITSLASLDPESIAAALGDLAAHPPLRMPIPSPALEAYLAGGDDLHALAPAIRAALDDPLSAMPAA